MTTFLRPLLTTALLAAACAASAQTAATKTYIVQLADAPAATYDGRIAGLPATRPAPGAKLDTRSAQGRAYLAHLAARRAAVLSGIGSVKMLHKYDAVLAGFSAQMTDAQARQLARNGGVKSVTEAEKLKLDTVSTPGFLGINGANGIWNTLAANGRNAKGEDVIIGIIDSGIWPENPSFGDKVDAQGNPVAYDQPGTLAYAPAPTKWRGACETGPGFTAAMCNNKLLGARVYSAGFDASSRALNAMEYRSPRDGGGHGTHTASTAGGNEQAPAVIDGISAGRMSGIAPRARLAAYKICWEGAVSTDSGCFNVDAIKAIDDAVQDGVDVLNYSISGTKTNFADPVEIAFLNATAAGVFVAASAGNTPSGSTVVASQVQHPGPWLTSVAASTHDRFTSASVTLGTGSSFTGPSYQATGLPATPMVLAKDVGINAFDSLNATEQTALMRCLNPANADDVALGASSRTALDPAKVAGKLVVCYRGSNVLVNKAATVKAAGGAAMIILNHPALTTPAVGASNNSTVLQPYVIPTVHLTNSAFAAVTGHAAAAGAAATAAFGPGTQQAGVVAPVMGTFSLNGPSQASADAMKPDISGPGVDIIAGYIDNGLSQAQHDALVNNNFRPGANAASLQGTSMSSPHLAGAAALMRQLYPTWSPAAIKSALMTTTTGMKLANGTADTNAFGYGAGHMNPNGAMNPGLVYDIPTTDYGRMLCGLGLTPPPGLGSCSNLGGLLLRDLNLASITMGNVPGNAAQTVRRKVTNVGNATATYNVTTALTGWNVVVAPTSLTLAPGQTAEFTVTANRTTSPIGTYRFGSLTWSDGVHTVRSPLTARAVGFTAPALVSDTRTSGKGSKVFSVTTIYNGTMSAVASGLVPATVTTSTIAKDARQCFDVTVPAGGQLLRFQTFASETVAPDLDLDVYAGPGGTGSLLGSSGGSTSSEVVTLGSPAAGTYSACVTGFDVPAGGASYKLSSWVVAAPVGVQSLKVAVPSAVYEGGSATVGLGWSVTAGQRYLGNVRFFDGSNALIGSTAVLVDNK